MFREGDKVRFKDETGEGIVLAVSGNKVLVLLPQGIEVPVDANKLVKVIFDATQHMIVPPHTAMSLKKDMPKGKRAQKAKRTREQYEIDLHIDELVDRSKGLSNGEMLTIQLNHFQFWIEKAIKDRAEKITFIHGVGEGVLKHEIRRMLAGYPGISFHDAPYGRYGFGATEVVIR